MIPVAYIAMKDVLDERSCQMERFGYSYESDRQYEIGELAAASASYALAAEMVQSGQDVPSRHPPSFWPWDHHHWKPDDEDPYRNMVKAMALGMAEMERHLLVKNSERIFFEKDVE